MIIRCAFFHGAVRPGREDAFETLLREALVPQWQRFPGVREVRLLRPQSGDAAAPPIALVLATRYDDLAAMQAALASPAREATREPTKALLEFFDGHVYHITFQGEDHAMTSLAGMSS